jgi:hypothetical protein
VTVDQPDDAAVQALRMRASDADRERVAGILRDAYAEGRLTREEYDDRLTVVYQAATYGDFVPVMADLPVPPGTIAIPFTSGVEVPRPADPNAPIVRTGVSVDTLNAVAIFGEVKRHGAWTVPAEFSATCIFGGGELDFTEAILTSRETILTSVCLFGGLEVIVPEGIIVRNEAVGIFGGVSLPKEIVAPPDAPVLVVRGAAIFGGIDVKRPKSSRRGRITG